MFPRPILAAACLFAMPASAEEARAAPPHQLTPSAAAAAAAAADEGPPIRTASLIVFGSDPCPRGSGDEIVVCARLPEAERYRLPKRFRGKHPDEPAHEAWGSRVSELESVSRQGTPNSCSVVGSGGQTGCMQQFLHQAYVDRKAAKAAAADPDVP